MSKARNLASGAPAPAGVSTTELGYVDGVTSAIQTQLNQKPEYAAGKNAIINGGFDIWQRGTTGVGATGAGTGFVVDRWQGIRSGYAAGLTISQQSPGSTLPQFRYCVRVQRDSGNTSTAGMFFTQQIETSNAILYAGQNITLSYYARVGATFSGSGNGDRQMYWGTGIDQNGATGSYTGSTQVTLTAVSGPTLSTSWQRYIYTGTIGSTATEMYLNLVFNPTGTAGATDYIEYTGVQIELGSTATVFSRAGGTIQGELAACQRYFQKSNNQSEAPGAAPATTPINAVNVSTTIVAGIPTFKVSMRASPTVTLYSTSTGTSGKIRSGGADITATAADVGENSIGYISATGLTAGSNSTITYTASAEL